MTELDEMIEFTEFIRELDTDGIRRLNDILIMECKMKLIPIIKNRTDYVKFHT